MPRAKEPAFDHADALRRCAARDAAALRALLDAEATRWHQMVGRMVAGEARIREALALALQGIWVDAAQATPGAEHDWIFARVRAAARQVAASDGARRSRWLGGGTAPAPPPAPSSAEWREEVWRAAAAALYLPASVPRPLRRASGRLRDEAPLPSPVATPGPASAAQSEGPTDRQTDPASDQPQTADEPVPVPSPFESPLARRARRIAERGVRPRSRHALPHARDGGEESGGTHAPPGPSPERPHLQVAEPSPQERPADAAPWDGVEGRGETAADPLAAAQVSQPPVPEPPPEPAPPEPLPAVPAAERDIAAAARPVPPEAPPADEPEPSDDGARSLPAVPFRLPSSPRRSGEGAQRLPPGTSRSPPSRSRASVGPEPDSGIESLVGRLKDEQIEWPEEWVTAPSPGDAPAKAPPGRVDVPTPLPGSFPVARRRLDYRELVPPRLKVPRSPPSSGVRPRAGLRAAARALVLGLLVVGGGYGSWVVARDVVLLSPDGWAWPSPDSWAWAWPDGWASPDSWAWAVDWPWAGDEQPALPEEPVRQVVAQEEPDALGKPDALDALLLESRAVRGLLPTQAHEFELGAQVRARGAPLAAPAARQVRDDGEPARRAADPAPVPSAANGLQVFIHHAAADSEGDVRARDLAGRLASAGVAIAGVRSIAVPIEEMEIRYFFEQDRAATEALRRSLVDIADLREAPELRDLSRFAAKPDPGSVEIWLAR